MARDRRAPCQESRPKSRRAAATESATLEDQCHPRKIFIGGLAHKTKTHHLREHFQKYGAIVDAVVLQWPDGRSRGFGYVTYSETSSAMAALELEHQVGGRQVDVKRAVPGTNKLFVGGLPQNASVAELRAHFEAFGVVSDAVVMMDPTTNRSRGFGFVCFLPGQEGATAVAASLEQYNNHRIRGKWIEVKSAAPPHKLAEGADAEPSPESSPAVRSSRGDASAASSRGDASSRKPPSAAGSPSFQLEPQKVTLMGATPAQPPGLCSTRPPPAGARMPPPGFLTAPPGKNGIPPQSMPWLPATAGFLPYHGGAVPSMQHQMAADPVKIQEDPWTSASMDLQRSLAQLLATKCAQEPEWIDVTANKIAKSPDRAGFESCFMPEELDFGSEIKAER